MSPQPAQRLDDVNAERSEWNRLAVEKGVRKAAWDEHDYDEGTAAHVELIHKALGDLRAGGYVLDLGCGAGRVMYRFARRFPFVNFVGVDVSPQMVRKVPKWPNVQALVGDGRTLPPMPMLMGAYSMLMFQHIPNAAVADYLEQVSRCLLPRAVFLFQYVEGDNATFLAHDANEKLVAGWCEQAGLDVEMTAPGAGRFADVWRWVKARKP